MFIEPAFGDSIPGLARQDLGINFLFPEHFDQLPLSIVIDARKPDQRGVSRFRRRDDSLHEIKPLANAGNSTRRR